MYTPLNRSRALDIEGTQLSPDGLTPDLVEKLIDEVAAELGVDPAVLGGDRAVERRTARRVLDGTVRVLRAQRDAGLVGTEGETGEGMTTYTADLVVLAPRGGVPNLLLIERGKNPFANRWALPGGKVDSGETFTQAALRELVEETGVRVGYSALRRVGMYDEYGRDPRGRYVSTAFLVVLGEMPTAVAGDDAADVRWVPVTELDPVELDRLAFDHGRIVSDALAAWQVERAYLPHLGALITAVA